MHNYYNLQTIKLCKLCLLSCHHSNTILSSDFGEESKQCHYQGRCHGNGSKSAVKKVGAAVRASHATLLPECIVRHVNTEIIRDCSTKGFYKLPCGPVYIKLVGLKVKQCCLETLYIITRTATYPVALAINFSSEIMLMRQHPSSSETCSRATLHSRPVLESFGGQTSLAGSPEGLYHQPMHPSIMSPMRL